MRSWSRRAAVAALAGERERVRARVPVGKPVAELERRCCGHAAMGKPSTLPQSRSEPFRAVQRSCCGGRGVSASQGGRLASLALALLCAWAAGIAAARRRKRSRRPAGREVLRALACLPACLLACVPAPAKRRAPALRLAAEEARREQSLYEAGPRRCGVRRRDEAAALRGGAARRRAAAAARASSQVA